MIKRQLENKRKYTREKIRNCELNKNERANEN